MKKNKSIVIEKQARDFRAKNGLNQIEAINLNSLLLKNNVLTVFSELGPDFSGFSLKISYQNEDKRFMLINSLHSLGRQHFTICHELYHLFIQEEFSSEISMLSKKGDIEELNADIFASYLLLPTDGIFNLIPNNELERGRVSLNTILMVENYFSCSRQALLNRLEGLGYIDEKLKTEFSIDIKKNALLHGYNTTLYEKGNSGIVLGDYGVIAKTLFDKGLVSESSYYSLLEDIGIDVSNLDDLTENEC